MLIKRTFALFSAFLILQFFHLEAAAEVKVGVILPYSGDFAKYGSLVRKGIEAGKGENIRLIYEDEACEAATAVKAYRKLAAFDGVKFFIGPCCGSPQSAVAPLLSQSKQMVVLGSSASEEIMRRSKGRILSSQPSIEAESRFIGLKMNERNYLSVVVIFVENDFSRAHEAAFKGAFKGKILETISLPAGDSSSFKSAALKVKQLKPSAIYVPDAAPLMLGLPKELSAIGLEEVPLWSIYSAQSAEVEQAISNAGETLIFSYPDIGEENALEYFPRKAIQLITAAAGECEDDADCAIEYLRRSFPFDESGALEGNLILKTLRSRGFERLSR